MIALLGWSLLLLASTFVWAWFMSRAIRWAEPELTELHDAVDALGRVAVEDHRRVLDWFNERMPRR